MSYTDMVEYVNTRSGVNCLDGSVLTLTFPETLIKSSFLPVVTKTVVSGVRVQVTEGCEGDTYNSVTYEDMVGYFGEQIEFAFTAISGVGDIVVTRSGGVTYIEGTG